MAGVTESSFTDLARAVTPEGEIVLRRRDGVDQLIVNGVFAMDSADVTSEYALADAAGRPPGLVVVGGLGLGYTAARLLDNRARRLHVVELARPLIDWAVQGVTEQLQRVAHDPRVQLHHGDVVEWLPRREESFDAILLDVDNGPGFLIHDQNARLYSAAWLVEALELLTPGGVLVVWCDSPSPVLADTLAGLGRVTETLIPVHREGRTFDYALYRVRRG